MTSFRIFYICRFNNIPVVRTARPLNSDPVIRVNGNAPDRVRTDNKFYFDGFQLIVPLFASNQHRGTVKLFYTGTILFRMEKYNTNVRIVGGGPAVRPAPGGYLLHIIVRELKTGLAGLFGRCEK